MSLRNHYHPSLTTCTSNQFSESLLEHGTPDLHDEISLGNIHIVLKDIRIDFQLLKAVKEIQ